jgi:molecular chaperone HscB
LLIAESFPLIANMHKTHFELFGLPPLFAIDIVRLDQAYRHLQAEVHPDRFAAATDSERHQSLQWATHANEAYRTLKNPLTRARYLLQLHGVDTQEESNTAMPADFLMRQMEWREAIEDAVVVADVEALEALDRGLRSEARSLREELSLALDEQNDYAGASEIVRKLRFLDKVQAEIDQAIDALES